MKNVSVSRIRRDLLSAKVGRALRARQVQGCDDIPRTECAGHLGEIEERRLRCGGITRNFQGLEIARRVFSKAWNSALLALLCASGTTLAGEPRVVATSQMELEFRDGWLTRWKNKLTDEEIRFSSGRAIPEAANSEFLKADETTAALTQSGAAVWAVRVPHDQTAVVHAEASVWRQRYLLIQGKNSGLLLQLDDPKAEQRATLERDEGRKEVTLTLRTAGQSPARWLIRQYVGGANWGAQHRLDYLARTHGVVAPDKRPAAWIQNVVMLVSEPPWRKPVVGTSWAQSLEIHHTWLDNLPRVVDADKILFCLDSATSAEPYTVLMASRVRRMGYHIQLRVNARSPLTGDAGRYAKVGEIVAALRALSADAVLLEDLPSDAGDGERQLFQLLRSELDQNGLATVALGVAGEPSEAALPHLDFCGGTDAALAILARGHAPYATPPLPMPVSLEALLADAEGQQFRLPPHTARSVFTPPQFSQFALARFWGENQPRMLEPKFFEPGDLARYRLNNERTLRFFSADTQTLRLAYDNGEVLADLVGGNWTNHAAFLDQYGPAFLKDKIGR